MIIQYSYDEQFKKNMKKLQRKDKGYDLLELDGIGEQLDVNSFSREFFSNKGQTTADVSVDSNSNLDGVSVVHYNNEIAKPIHRLNSYYLAWKYSRRLYNEDIAFNIIQKQFNKEIYINDFHGFGLLPYCFNFSCMDIVCQGLPFVTKIESKAPKHLSSFMGQIIQFVTFACNSILGAVGLADLLICASYFVEKMFEENPTIPKKYLEKQIKQELQSFIYSVNQPFRSAVQSPFSNVSIYDDVFLTKLCDEYVFPNGKKVKKETVKYLQDIFINLMNETLEVTPATFPITTACLAVNEDKEILDEEFLKYISKQNLQFGFMNIYAGKTSTLSSCCRLRSEGETEYFNTFGSGGTKIGSLGVVTLNLPRLAFTSKTKEEFLQKLEENVILAAQINNTKRFLIKKRIDAGHAPLYSLGFMALTKQYSTCGIVGVNEALEILGEDILKEGGKLFVEQMLDKINEVNAKMAKKYGAPHNTEQVPAENCLSGDTLIKTIYGHKKIKDLVGKEIPVFSYDKNIRKPVIKLAKNIRKTIIDAEVYRVWFDNDTYIDATANHKFAKNIRPEGKNIGIYDIQWVRCKDLKKKDSIKHLIKLERERIYYNGLKESHLIYKYFYGDIPNGSVIHHKDENKKNNDISNLECLTDTEHKSLHGSKHVVSTCQCCMCKAKRGEYVGKNNPFYGKKHTQETIDKYSIKISKTLKGVPKTLEHRRKLSISAKNKSEEKTSNWNHGITTETVLKMYCEGITQQEIANKLKCTTGLIQGRLKKCALNHKVVKVEKLNHREDVYDMEIEDTHCFFAGDDVLIHNSSAKLATADRILGFNTKYDIYSNQFIPLVSDADIQDRIKIQGRFDKHMTGGAICHLNIVDQITDYKFMVNLIKHAVKQGVIYAAVNYNLQKCKIGHMTVGTKKKCSICGEIITDNFTRVVGFLVNTKNWHKTRREIDYPNRKWYKELK